MANNPQGNSGSGNSANSTINLKALGLVSQPNELSVQPGSLKTADNIIIRRDNIIESRRGFKLYGESFGSSSDRADQLFNYKKTILRHYNDLLQFDTGLQDVNGENIFDTFCGTYPPVQSGLRIKSIEANGNLYFTTANGIQKLAARTAEDFTTACGYIINAGGIEALDPSSYLNVVLGSGSGFLPVDSTVAYRIVWGTNDINGNLILGTPSARTVVYNPLQQMLVRDFNQVLEALDNVDDPVQSYITDGNYVEELVLPLNATGENIQQNFITLAEKIDLDQPVLFDSSAITSASIDGVNFCTVTLSSNSIGLLSKLQVGDQIFLGGNWVDTAGNDFGSNAVGTTYTVATISLLGSNNTFGIQTASAAAGTVTLTSPDIETGWFRSIPQPAIPDAPATHDELVALQQYLVSIILELQSARNIVIASTTTSIGGSIPLFISSATVNAINSLEVFNLNSENATDVYLPGQKVSLVGTWMAGADNLDGNYTVSSVPSNTQVNITINSSSVGSVVLDNTSKVDIIRRFSTALQLEFISILNVTLAANVNIVIPIPEQVTPNYFFQIYRI